MRRHSRVAIRNSSESVTQEFVDRVVKASIIGSDRHTTIPVERPLNRIPASVIYREFLMETCWLLKYCFFGPIVERIGYRRSILTMLPLLALLCAIASFAGGRLSFFLLLFPVGIA
jgi:hypothetical protein